MNPTLKKFILLKSLCVVSVVLSLVLWEMYVREPVMNWTSGEEITWERPEPEPTEMEVWLANEENRAEVELLMLRDKRDKLNEEITARETKKQ
jgi:hypothetical protein